MAKRELKVATKTSCITVAQYVDLYCGPEIIFYEQYASMIKIVFVTFTYGFALPVLFPIAAFSFMVMYIT